MSALLCADDSTSTINSNFTHRRIKSGKHHLNQNFRREWGVFSTKNKQPSESNVGATTHFAMLLFLFPSKKHWRIEMESAECSPPWRRIQRFFLLIER
jgi:hypothetical protein